MASAFEEPVLGELDRHPQPVATRRITTISVGCSAAFARVHVPHRTAALRAVKQPTEHVARQPAVALERTAGHASRKLTFNSAKCVLADATAQADLLGDHA